MYAEIKISGLWNGRRNVTETLLYKGEGPTLDYKVQQYPHDGAKRELYAAAFSVGKIQSGETLLRITCTLCGRHKIYDLLTCV